jgi:hypothetical protein
MSSGPRHDVGVLGVDGFPGFHAPQVADPGASSTGMCAAALFQVCCNEAAG